jgi:ATP-binding cassette subfamily C (CFTR/MRP) protein 1
MVLRGISFDVKAGEKVDALHEQKFKSNPCTDCVRNKIGIVGRTGAGKSSILQALFRLVELSKGKIFIDGTDISTVGLDTLRQSISAIPQEPLLFSGTMRENLDPEGSCTDAQLHDALRRCDLVSEEGRDDERLTKFKLDAEVADEGKSFSSVFCSRFVSKRTLC